MTKTSHTVTKLSYLCSESSLCQKCLQCTLCSLLCVLCVLAACENKSQSCLLCSRVGGTREVKTIARLLWQYTFIRFQPNPWCDHVDHDHNDDDDDDGDVFCWQWWPWRERTNGQTWSGILWRNAFNWFHNHRSTNVLAAKRTCHANQLTHKTILTFCHKLQKT